MNHLEMQEFFKLIDANGVGRRWSAVSIMNVRAYFEECFGLKPPPYPQLDEESIRTRSEIEPDWCTPWDIEEQLTDEVRRILKETP